MENAFWGRRAAAHRQHLSLLSIGRSLLWAWKRRLFWDGGPTKKTKQNKNIVIKKVNHYMPSPLFIILLSFSAWHPMWSWSSCHFHFREEKMWHRERLENLPQVAELLRVEPDNSWTREVELQLPSSSLGSNTLLCGALSNMEHCPETWLICVSLEKKTRSLTWWQQLQFTWSTEQFTKNFPHAFSYLILTLTYQRSVITPMRSWGSRSPSCDLAEPWSKLPMSGTPRPGLSS